MNNLIKRQLKLIDCTKEYDEGKYFFHGKVQVVESSAGCYREAESKPLSRFGYRFIIENTKRPHLAVIRYPDDKRRYMCIMDGTSYDLTTGIFTGFEQPLSGQMKEIQHIFWPRWNDCSIVFMTWGNGEPAAVSSIEVFEMNDLPAFEMTQNRDNGTRRELGIQYEDPCGTGASEGAMSHKEWQERVIAYAKFTGQKLIVYPIVWYHGPQFPSRVEPSDSSDIVVAYDRKQYIRWTTNPTDWLSGMLPQLEKEKLEFVGSLTLLRIGTLMERMNTDINSIRAGTETINNMLWDDNVQAGTQDWTTIYNARNYNKILEFNENSADMKDFPWIYGEKNDQSYPGGPIFNPLHPVVQEAIIRLVTEIVDLYGDFQAFKGISFNMWHSTFLWFGSIRSGYDDYTVSLFEKETCIIVPVEAKAPDRFSRRYRFLTFNCRPAWIAWRCKKIYSLFCIIRDTITNKRPDMRLTITIWNEMTIPLLLGLSSGAGHQLHARMSNAELYREAGLDIELFKNEPGIEIDLQLEPQRDRSPLGSETEGSGIPAERASMYRDHDFLDEETKEQMRNIKHFGNFIFDSWVEAWGKHRWFPCCPDDTQAKELAVMSGKPAEGIFRINSEYPEDDFWWDSQLRITTAFPGGIHYMEHYAYAVAEYDACRITRGGLYLDKSHSEQIQQFARAYRALPSEKFDTVGKSSDPVAVRKLICDGRYYFYLVNREYYPVKITLTFNRIPEDLTDLSNNETINLTQENWQLLLAPYELRSFTIKPEAEILGFEIIIPDSIVNLLKTQAMEVLKIFNKAHTLGIEISGMDCIASGIESALENGSFSWVRKALGCYIVRKCSELIKIKNSK